MTNDNEEIKDAVVLPGPADPPPESGAEAVNEMAERSALATQDGEKADWGQILNPTNRKDAWEMCVRVGRSEMCPKAYKGKSFEIAIAGALGQRVGFDLITSLQAICVINGMPTMWGDRMVGLCMSQPDYVDLVPLFEPDVEGGKYTYTAKRKDRADCVGFYSMAVAEKAGLTKKSGPWREVPLRMVQQRARTFALRDQWPDILGGFTATEDLQHLNPAGGGGSREIEL